MLTKTLALFYTEPRSYSKYGEDLTAETNSSVKHARTCSSYCCTLSYSSEMMRSKRGSALQSRRDCIGPRHCGHTFSLSSQSTPCFVKHGYMTKLLIIGPHFQGQEVA